MGIDEVRTGYSSAANPTADGVGTNDISDPFDTSSPSYADTTGNGMSTASGRSIR